MDGRRHAGYTIVEVTLFLAITAMLFVIALIGTGNTIRSTRFTDSGRSLTAFVQRQYDAIINGLNTRPGAEQCAGGTVTTGTPQTPGTSDCLLMGKLLTFSSNSSAITIYNVIGTEPAGVDYTQTDTALITAFNPRAVTNTGVTTYNIPWGAMFTGSKRLADNEAVDALLLVRSPKSSRIVNYVYDAPSTIGAAIVDQGSAAVVPNAANRGKTANFCIKNNDGLGLPAKLVVSDAPTQSAVQIFFDADSGGSECNGV
jgi:hypothetical protein